MADRCKNGCAWKPDKGDLYCPKCSAEIIRQVRAEHDRKYRQPRKRPDENYGRPELPIELPDGLGDE